MPPPRFFSVPIMAAMVALLCYSAAVRAITLSGVAPSNAVIGASYYFKPTLGGTKSTSTKFYIAGRPSWASFSSSTGLISGTPTAAGHWQGIQITAWDGSQVATLPAFSITAGQAGANLNVKISGVPATLAEVGAYYGFRPTVAAAPGAKLTYTIVNKPSWAQFNPASGTLSGTPADKDQAAYANVAIAVSDGKSTAALPAFKITVGKPAAGSALVSWTKPLTNTDGTTLSNLSGYRIHYGNTLASLPRQLTIGGAANTSAMIEGLARGTWYFAVVAYTNVGVESAMSSAARKVIN